MVLTEREEEARQGIEQRLNQKKRKERNLKITVLALVALSMVNYFELAELRVMATQTKAIQINRTPVIDSSIRDHGVVIDTALIRHETYIE